SPSSLETRRPSSGRPTRSRASATASRKPDLHDHPQDDALARLVDLRQLPGELLDLHGIPELRTEPVMGDGGHHQESAVFRRELLLLPVRALHLRPPHLAGAPAPVPRTGCRMALKRL